MIEAKVDWGIELNHNSDLRHSAVSLYRILFPHQTRSNSEEANENVALSIDRIERPRYLKKVISGVFKLKTMVLQLSD